MKFRMVSLFCCQNTSFLFVRWNIFFSCLLYIYIYEYAAITQDCLWLMGSSTSKNFKSSQPDCLRFRKSFYDFNSMFADRFGKTSSISQDQTAYVVYYCIMLCSQNKCYKLGITRMLSATVQFSLLSPIIFNIYIFFILLC